MNILPKIAALFLLAFLAAPAATAEGLARDTPVHGRVAAHAAGHAVVPVSFLFATREEGHELLLNDVHVVIQCPVVGSLFEGVSDGPYLVANLPQGRYDVVASHEGRSQRIALEVPSGASQVALYW